MKKLDKETTIAAINVLAGKRYSSILNEKHPIEELLAETRVSDQQGVATETVTTLLKLVDTSKSRLFRDLDSLSLALAIGTAYRLETGVAERLIQTAARCGFHGRFPDLPKILLNRQPDAGEITLLISAYVKDTGCRSTSTEEKLRCFAKTYLPKDEAASQLRRIDKFVTEFNRNDF